MVACIVPATNGKVYRMAIGQGSEARSAQEVAHRRADLPRRGNRPESTGRATLLSRARRDVGVDPGAGRRLPLAERDRQARPRRSRGDALVTGLEQFAVETAKLVEAAARTETLERHHRVLVAGSTRLAGAAKRQHDLGRRRDRPACPPQAADGARRHRSARVHQDRAAAGDKRAIAARMTAEPTTGAGGAGWRPAVQG